MGNCRCRHYCTARAALRRLSCTKTVVKETPQGQGPEEGHEGRNGCQGRSNVGRVDIEGTITRNAGLRPMSDYIATKSLDLVAQQSGVHELGGLVV